jgi:hypothetical protein
MTLLLAGAAKAQAEVSVRIGVGSEWPVHPDYHRNYWARRYYRPYRAVRIAPVVVTPAPYYAGYPYPVYVPAPPPVVQSPPQYGAPESTGSYGSDLANLNEKLSRLRGVVQRQNQKGSIPQDQYNRFMNTLDGIERDEHARAFDRGGNLAPEDFADLYRRLDQAGEDIEIALAV